MCEKNVAEQGEIELTYFVRGSQVIDHLLQGATLRIASNDGVDRLDQGIPWWPVKSLLDFGLDTRENRSWWRAPANNDEIDGVMKLFCDRIPYSGLPSIREVRKDLSVHGLR